MTAFALLAATVGVAGCSGSTSSASSEARARVHVTSGATTTTTTPATCSDAEKAGFDATASYAPDRSAASGARPDGSQLPADVLRTGKLRAGVDENTPGFGVRNRDGKLEGLEIDLVRRIAARIWPGSDPDDRIQWVTVVTEQKIPYVKDRKVDLTASVVTMSCDRWKDVAFSTSYFTTPQRIMVATNSPIQHLADVKGRTVCVTKGSSTTKLVEQLGAKLDEVDARTDCLVDLQEGRADAVASHDTILWGLHQQDLPNTRIIEEDLPASNYGVAMNRHDEAFVRLVNGVLEDMRDDGSLAALYQQWLGEHGYQPPPVPEAHYRSEP